MALDRIIPHVFDHSCRLMFQETVPSSWLDWLVANEEEKILHLAVLRTPAGPSFACRNRMY